MGYSGQGESFRFHLCAKLLKIPHCPKLSTLSKIIHFLELPNLDYRCLELPSVLLYQNVNQSLFFFFIYLKKI